MSEERKRTKEQEDLEYFRKKYPDLNIQLTPKEERSQHRIFIGKPPVARPRPEREEEVKADE